MFSFPQADRSQSTSVPIFALHPKGTYYIPMSIDYSIIAPFMVVYTNPNASLSGSDPDLQQDGTAGVVTQMVLYNAIARYDRPILARSDSSRRRVRKAS